MKYLEFEVHNFKGINKLNLKIDHIPHLNIFTLVGLNESGKTTILEAINYFQNSSGDPNELIPKSKRANFNDKIIIKATLMPSDEDEQKIRDFARNNGFLIDQKIGGFSIKHSYPFSKSTYDASKMEKLWSINLSGIPKKSRSKKSTQLLSYNRDIWLKVVDFIREKLVPKIVYYPNFLFDFPTAIYLEQFEGEGQEQEFYRNVLQDVLDTLNQDLLLKDHLVDRKKAGGKNDLANIEKVLNDMAGIMTKLVFEAWVKISNIKTSNISVTLGNDIKTDPQGRLFIEIKIKEGTDSYYVGERSLGFRWFFAFLLFTQFRKHRSSEVGNMLFLLDEPASNLHQTGQQELLNSLEQLTDGSMVIYSTHSHHLINPKWLSGAFIVTNKGLNPDAKALTDDFNATKTNIAVERYYTFVANHPDEQTHYKPILDVLDYKPGKLENIPNIIITEGKFDFYTFNYFQDYVFKPNPKEKLNFYPGAGKDKHDDIIALYLSWGRDFLVLLDGDPGGKSAKKRYINDFGKAVENEIFTLVDIDNSFDKFTTEDLIPEQERVAFTKTVFPTSRQYKKSEFNSAIQQNYINGVKFSFSKEAKKNIKTVLDFLKTKQSKQ